MYFSIHDFHNDMDFIWEEIRGDLPEEFKTNMWVTGFKAKQVIEDDSGMTFKYEVSIHVEGVEDVRIVVHCDIEFPCRIGSFLAEAQSYVRFARKFETAEEALEVAEKELASIQSGKHFKPTEEWYECE